MGRKAAHRLGSWLILLGAIGIIASVVWWHSFYGGVIGEPLVCLYRLSGPCQMVSNVASFFGAASYDARLLWTSGIAIAVGLILHR
jgi:hypothetical protein